MKAKHIVAVVMMSLSALVIGAPKDGGGGGGEAATGYLGHTSATFDGSASLSSMFAACQTDFEDAQAVVCTSKQILESPSIATLTISPGSSMWVRPFVVGGPDAGHIADYSGITQQSDKLTWCHTNNSNNYSMLMTVNGQIMTDLKFL
jgi:hypothetical protein